MKLMFTPESPKFTQNAGHVARLRTTTASGGSHGSRFADETVSEPGASRIFHNVATAMVNDTTPAATNTPRHDTSVTSQASGAVAANAPSIPKTLPHPLAVAKRRSSNQFAFNFMTQIHALATPIPTSVRPAAAMAS